MTDWGTLTVGRITLRETVTVSETGGDGRSLSVSGQESTPPLSRAELVARHDDLLALDAQQVLPVTWTDKPERDGYYTPGAPSADLTDQQGETVTSTWRLNLTRVGTAGETDLQSRLAGAARANDHSLTGERWHAPPIGHYAYYTGATQPTAATRGTEDGTITIYRSLPAAVSPRWGCAASSYELGRVRVISQGLERSGTDVPIDEADWELSNALVRARLVSGSLEIASWDGANWDTKLWTVTANSTTITSWNSATVLRNEYELCILRLTKSRSPGRTTLDLTLRRGSRVIEGYLQNDTSTTLSVSLTASEATTSGTGYVVATSTDTDGNKYTAGTARTFTTHANGGITKASTTTLDWYAGAVMNSASPATVDGATVLRDMYLGALPEQVTGVRR